MATTRIPSVEGGIQPTVLTTTGDILYASSASNPARLGIGSASQVLTVASGIPSWATPASGGKVLQVVSATTTTATNIATTTQTDTTITATITPTLITSKILVLISANMYIARASTRQEVDAKVLRDATTILDYATSDKSIFSIEGSNLTGLYANNVAGISYLDSPATTSATTYKMQAAVLYTANSGAVTFQQGSAPSTITLMEIGA